MKSKTIAKVGAFLTAFTVFAGSMLPVYAASVDETDSTEESTAAAAEGDEESFLFQLDGQCESRRCDYGFLYPEADRCRGSIYHVCHAG